MGNDLNDSMKCEIDSAEYLDCKELQCPMPIVRVSKAVKAMASGQKLIVEASDPAFKSDLEAWARTMDCELLEFVEGPVARAVIRKP